MTLIDTPGFNDPNTSRDDKTIFMELINNIRPPLRSPNKGISIFVQCVMPDESDRIKDSTINTMMNLFLILSIFNTKTLPEELLKHPKIAVVFSNVSKYQDRQRAQKRIDTYRTLLLQKAYKSYCFEISDDTKVADHKWKDIKSQSFEKEPWYAELDEFDQNILKSLKTA